MHLDTHICMHTHTHMHTDTYSNTNHLWCKLKISLDNLKQKVWVQQCKVLNAKWQALNLHTQSRKNINTFLQINKCIIFILNIYDIEAQYSRQKTNNLCRDNQHSIKEVKDKQECIYKTAEHYQHGYRPGLLIKSSAFNANFSVNFSLKKHPISNKLTLLPIFYNSLNCTT